MGDKSQQVSGTVAASPEKVFALLADPARHAEMDGSDMLRGLDSGPSPVTQVGDAFVINMSAEGVGDYQMRSEIVAFEPGRKIAWAPTIYPPGSLEHIIGDMDVSGHEYGWELEASGDGGTRVTHTYDWNGVRDEKALELFPRVSEEQMAGSIKRLGDALG